MQIAVSHTFLRSIVHVPPKVLSSINQFIRSIEASPHLRPGRRIRGENYFRVRISGSYRLFFLSENNVLILLEVRRRNERTYKNLQNINNEQHKYSTENSFHEIKIPELENTDEPEPENTDEPEIENCIIQLDELEESSIPKEYWNKLLTVRDEDELLALELPDEYLDYIIDKFSLIPSTPIEELKYETYYSLSSESDLDRFCKNDISISDYIIRNLYLTEEQKSILEDQTPGPILVKGGPGTGKSILALYKVKQLVESGKKNILFTTYNQALAEQSKKYLEVLLNPNLDKVSVEVKTVSEVAERIFYETNKGHRICNEKQSALLLDVSIELIGNTRAVRNISRNYILEEFRIVIDGRGIQSKRDYLDNRRVGRDIRLNQQQRKAIWNIYEEWTDLLDKSGLITREKIKREVLATVKAKNKYHFDHIVIDEAQDLSPVSLKLLFSLAPKKEFYLTADTDQSLYQRSFGWDQIQHYIGYEEGTTRLLRKGFRSIYEVWRAYNNLMPGFRTIEADQRQGKKPEILYTDDPITQVEHIKDFLIRAVKKSPRDPRYASVILVPDVDYGKLLSFQLTRHGLPARYVERKEDYGMSERRINVMLIKESKGLEFPYVIVAGLKEGLLPDLDLEAHPEKKQLLQQCEHLFYVACSRAKNSLLVCASSSHPSSLLNDINNDHWEIIRK